MANILYTWELGAGFGHIAPFYPIAKRLIKHGHSVSLVVQDLSRAKVVFGDTAVKLFQAPHRPPRWQVDYPDPVTFGHLLMNAALGDSSFLTAAIEAWENLFEVIQPDCLISDHSPIALLAARGREFSKLVFGTGFTCPTDGFPQSEMVSWRTMRSELRIRDEIRFVGQVNQVLATTGRPKIDRISQIYVDSNDQLLTTFQELDHFPEREHPKYLGVWSRYIDEESSVDGEVDRPSGEGPKIFAYVNASSGLSELLRWLAGQQLPTVVVGYGLDQVSIPDTATLRCYPHHLNLTSIRKSCDLAILNGNHGTTCEFLLAGCPSLQLPHTLEQAMLAKRIVDLGAGLDASPEQSRQSIQQLSTLLNSVDAKEAAVKFAERYASFSPLASIAECVERIEKTI